MNPKVDLYFSEGCGRCPLGGTPACKVNNWVKEMKLLRSILLDCHLQEELKWGIPCYSFQKKNVVTLSAFKEHCALGFFKGVLLQDAEGILDKPGENTQAARLIKFTGTHEIAEMAPTLKAYVFEAIEIEKAGLKAEFKENPEPMPPELQRVLDRNAELKAAFEALTPGRQRGYILYFSQPKQSKTRELRIEKYREKILRGEGLNDKYSGGK